MHQVREPQRQTIDEARLIASFARERRGNIQRRFVLDPPTPAPRLVMVDPLAHLVIESFRGRDVSPRRWQGGYKALGIGAFAGSRSPKDQRQRRQYLSGHIGLSNGIWGTLGD
jgi:hypothetical protein